MGMWWLVNGWSYVDMVIVGHMGVWRLVDGDVIGGWGIWGWAIECDRW